MKNRRRTILVPGLLGVILCLHVGLSAAGDLQKLWYDKPVPELRTKRLHQRYCRVMDAKWYDRQSPPVIEHTQASRRLKYVVHGQHKGRKGAPIP